MAGIEDLKVGKKILIDGIPYEVVKLEHLKKARGQGMEKTILKNLLTGNMMQKTFREVDKIEQANINHYTAEFLYNDINGYNFMNSETYEQVCLLEEIIGDNVYFLNEGDKVILQEFDGIAINIQVEPSVCLEIIDTPPGEKGDTATGGKKPATLITGLIVQVPLFLCIGDKIKVDTRTKDYLGRV